VNFLPLTPSGTTWVGDAEVVGLVGVAVLELLVALGAVDEIEADDDVLVVGADVEAVAVHVAVGQDGVLEFSHLPRRRAAGGGRRGRNIQYPISNIQCKGTAGSFPDRLVRLRMLNIEQ
jgi:hypothetical protein